MQDEIWSLAQAAEFLGIKPESARRLLVKRGVQRGYRRSEVEAVERTQGRRTDLYPLHALQYVEEQEDPEGWRQWRWHCACGSRGHWNFQSSNVSRHAWARHAVADLNVDPESEES